MKIAPSKVVVITLSAALWSCNGEKKKSDTDSAPPSSPSPTTNTGSVAIDTDTESDVTTSTKTGPDITGSDEESLVVTGQVALQTALTDAPAGKVAAFEFSGSVFSPGTAPVLFNVDAQGRFEATLPKKGNQHAYDPFFRTDGSVDVAKARAGLPAQDTQGKNDLEVAQAVREGKAYYDNIGYVLIGFSPETPASNSWQDRLVARAAETDSFKFIGLKAGDNALLGFPCKRTSYPKSTLES